MGDLFEGGQGLDSGQPRSALAFPRFSYVSLDQGPLTPWAPFCKTEMILTKLRR